MNSEKFIPNPNEQSQCSFKGSSNREFYRISLLQGGLLVHLNCSVRERRLTQTQQWASRVTFVCWGSSRLRWVIIFMTSGLWTLYQRIRSPAFPVQSLVDFDSKWVRPNPWPQNCVGSAELLSQSSTLLCPWLVCDLYPSPWHLTWERTS